MDNDILSGNRILTAQRNSFLHFAPCTSIETLLTMVADTTEFSIFPVILKQKPIIPHREATSHDTLLCF